MAFYAMSRSMRIVQLALEKAPYKSFGNYPRKETKMQEELRKGKRKALQLPNYMEETEFQSVCSKNQNYEPVYDKMTRDESVFQPAYEQKIFNKSLIQVFEDGDEGR